MAFICRLRQICAVHDIALEFSISYMVISSHKRKRGFILMINLAKDILIPFSETVLETVAEAYASLACASRWYEAELPDELKK